MKELSSHRIGSKILFNSPHLKRFICRYLKKSTFNWNNFFLRFRKPSKRYERRISQSGEKSMLSYFDPRNDSVRKQEVEQMTISLNFCSQPYVNFNSLSWHLLSANVVQELCLKTASDCRSDAKTWLSFIWKED